MRAHPWPSSRRVGSLQAQPATRRRSSPLQRGTLSEVRSRHGDEAAAVYAAANVAAVERVAQLVADDQIDCDFARASACTYAVDRRGVGAIDAECEALLAAGVAARRGDADELPFEVAAAVWLDDQVQLHLAGIASGSLARSSNAAACSSTAACSTSPNVTASARSRWRRASSRPATWSWPPTCRSPTAVDTSPVSTRIAPMRSQLGSVVHRSRGCTSASTSRRAASAQPPTAGRCSAGKVTRSATTTTRAGATRHSRTGRGPRSTSWKSGGDGRRRTTAVDGLPYVGRLSSSTARCGRRPGSANGG